MFESCDWERVGTFGLKFLGDVYGDIFELYEVLSFLLVLLICGLKVHCSISLRAFSWSATLFIYYLFSYVAFMSSLFSGLRYWMRGDILIDCTADDGFFSYTISLSSFAISLSSCYFFEFNCWSYDILVFTWGWGLGITWLGWSMDFLLKFWEVREMSICYDCAVE